MALKGVLDLRSWDLSQDGSLNLNGEWAFYWGQLLFPEDFSAADPASPMIYFSVPGCWNQSGPHGSALSGDGFATFRLKVKITPDESPMGVRILNQSSAYALWINGKLVARNGVVGKSPEAAVPQYLLQEVSFFEKGPVLDMVLQVANFNHKNGGAWSPIRLGTASQIKSLHNLQFIFDLLLFGSLLIMGLYHSCLYYLRREDPSTLYFAAFTLVIAARVMVTGNYYFTLVFPNGSWELLYKVELLSMMIPLPVLLLFVTSVFNLQKSIAVQYLFIGTWAALSLITLLVPARISSHLVMPAQVIILLNIGFILIILAAALRQRQKGARILLTGIAVFGCTAVIDILIVNRIFYAVKCVPFGVFCLVFSQSFLLSSRFADAFQKVNRLSMELEQKNIALRRMDQVKDAFLANTSHELRTPLHGIMGIAESLIAGAAGRVPQKAVANLSMILSSAKRLAGLVDEIMDFSKLKNRDITLVKKPVDIKTLVNGVLYVIGTMAGTKALKLTQTIPENIPHVLGDENRLQQILYNLIGNAVKFTDQGEVRVGAEQKGDMVEIWVSDTGIGIRKDQFEKVFCAFEQADSGPSRQFQGTGLGLSITRHLVELHGGRIRVESTFGKGSTFFFTMPVSPGDTTNFAQVSQKPDGLCENHMVFPGYERPAISDMGQSGPASCQVLVVDDDPVNLQVVANYLCLENISFGTAPDGIEALKRIESGQKPQVLLLDIMMPKMTGYEVCRRLRKKFTPSELPVIMLTAKNRVADLKEGYRAGANDYLSKPFSRDELIARVNCHLSLKKAYETVLDNQRLQRELEEQKQQKERAKFQEEKARIEMLRYQLNPHFLFNALSSIRGAIAADGEAARRMVSHLAEFCRLALSREAVLSQTVNREMEIVRHYLVMEEMRFNDYLKVSIEIEPGAGEIEIPALIIHPLVENAVKYGQLTSPDRLDVGIRAELSKPGRLKLTISNTGTWIEPGAAGPSTGIGVENIRHRLDISYSGDFSFENFEEKGYVKIEIAVPLTLC